VHPMQYGRSGFGSLSIISMSWLGGNVGCRYRLQEEHESGY
jgi:hypothetical protein